MSAEDAEYEEPTRAYLTVPFSDKDEVKSLGARWDPASKRWYIGSDCSENNLKELDCWKNPKYLTVPFDDKNAAKAAGAAWDATKKKWYVPPNSAPETQNTLMEQWDVWTPDIDSPLVRSNDLSPIGDVTYLKVAYSDRNSVKAGGALWSSAKKKWYIPANATQEVCDFLVANWGENAAEEPPPMNDYEDDGFDPYDANC